MIMLNLSLSGCMTTATVADAAGSTVVSAGETIIDVIDIITPDIFTDDK